MLLRNIRVCRALLCEQTEEQMEAAWLVFNPSGAEAISADEFKQLLPLLGEDVEEEMVRKGRRGAGCRALADACWCL